MTEQEQAPSLATISWLLACIADAQASDRAMDSDAGFLQWVADECRYKARELSREDRSYA